MRILITGAAGFPGSNLSKFLAEKYPDYSIMALDAIAEGAQPGKNLSFWRGELRNEILMENLVRNADVLVHIASAPAEGGPAGRLIEEHITGISVLLESARRHPLTLIHVSSSEVYGNPQTLPLTEEHPMTPKTLRGGLASASDALVLALSCDYKIASVILRPFSLYGPGQDPAAGIARLITSGISRRPVPVRGDGSPTRDRIFVDDFCLAVDKAIHADITELAGEIINIGTGRETSDNQAAAEVLEILGESESLITFVEEQPGFPKKIVSSTSKAELLLDWQPAVAFSQGIKTTVNWYRENQKWWRDKTT